MKSINKYLLFAAGLFLAACSEETATEVSLDEEKNNINGITMTAADFDTDDATRTAITLDGSKLKFSWSEGDNVGVFGESKLQQVLLNMQSGAETKSATFTSSDYQLVKDKNYVAYYPMVNNVGQHADNIPVSYMGQKQTKNDDLTHLSPYDYIVSDPTTATETNTAAFTLKHIGTLLRLKLTMPEAGTWQSVTLTTTEEAFISSATIDLFTKELSDAVKSTSVTLDLNNITTEANGVLTAWIMLSPIDLTSKTVSVSVLSSDGKEYVASFIPSKAYAAGKAYSVSATMEDSPFLSGKFKVGDDTYVTFATGNLQYNLGTKKYQLAANQWEYLCSNGYSCWLSSDDNYVAGTDYTDANGNYVLDLFGWGTGRNPTYASTTDTDYLGSTCSWSDNTVTTTTTSANFNSDDDWGTVAAANVNALMGLRTLKYTEWRGLFQNQCWAYVKLSGDGISTSVLGLVVFPYGVTSDDITSNGYCTGTIFTNKYNDYSNNTSTVGTMTVENLNKSGALFLPAGGYRNGREGYAVNQHGYYWSSSVGSSVSRSQNLYFRMGYMAYGNNFLRHNGSSVRLAKDVK